MTPIEQAWQGYIAAMEWTATVCRSDDPEGNDPEPLDHFDTEEVDHRAELWEGFADYFEQVAEWRRNKTPSAMIRTTFRPTPTCIDIARPISIAIPTH